MKRVIIDCDPSADDALALMLAAASAELSLEAVTAVSGVCEVVQSARNALNILGAVRQVRCISGCREPASH